MIVWDILKYSEGSMAESRKKETIEALERRLIAEIEQKHGKPVDQLYQERNKRLCALSELLFNRWRFGNFERCYRLQAGTPNLIPALNK